MAANSTDFGAVASHPEAAVSRSIGVRSRLVFGYDGTNFKGWAVQPGQRTVEGELVAGLERLLRHPVRLTVAGRTDTGVHAEGQVASYDGSPPSLRALNAVLPEDIVVSVSEAAELGFDARADATSRAYAYRIAPGMARPLEDRHRTLWWPRELDLDRLDQCAELLPGSHDLTAFTPTQSLHRHFTRKILSAGWVRLGQRIEFRIEAESFLRHMNRVLVGTMIEVASGEMSVAQFADLLNGRPRIEAGPTAQPHGLRLIGVSYSAKERILHLPG